MAEHDEHSLRQAPPPPGPAQSLPGPLGGPGAAHLTRSAASTEQLRWAQKMETLGRLGARITHEVNNQLTLLLGRTNLVLQRGEEEGASRAEVEELHRVAKHVARLMRQWQTLGRHDPPVWRPLDLNALLAETVATFGTVLDQSIDLTTDYRAASAWVLAERGHLEHVVLNLLFNARDALAGSGALVVRTAHVELPAPGGEYLMPYTPGSYVMFSVRDTGCGMDRATLARIFEPYFTTKGPEKGSGLGLHNVWEIVKECGGTLQVASAPGQGTIFSVYLPQAPEGAEALPAPLRAVPRPAKETILVVEDEDGVRALVREVLRRQGYAVLEAGDGPTALNLAATHDGPIHLLVSDCVLPHLSAGELAERLRERYPDLRVLYVSGYASNHADDEAPFLQKPFSPATLASVVRELLAARR
jgi:nitrogen-specific signal transduction histidine kinase